MRNGKILIALLTGLALFTSTYVAAEHDDREQDSPGFFGRIWESTKSILGIPSDRDEGRDDDRYDDRDDEDEDEDEHKDKDKYKDKNKDKDKHGSKSEDRDRDHYADERRRFFSDDEKRILRDYYAGEHSQSHKKQKSLPPGLKKKVERGGELPPGWQKKMARGEVIPEDVYRYGQTPPDDILRRLPRQPDGTRVIYVEGKIARVLDATRTVIDVFDL